MHIQVSLIVEVDASADLATMEEQVQAAGHQSMRLAFQRMVRQWEQEHRRCPRCSSQHVRLEGTVARCVQTLFGAVRLARQRLRCQHCLHRFCPANQRLSPMQRGRVSPALADAACLAGASWPYRQAAGVLKRLSGAQISAEEIRLLTNQQGRYAARQQEQEALEAAESLTQEQASESALLGGVDRTIIGLDGGWVPSREQRGGMEGKVAVVATHRQVMREPSAPNAQMNWYELSKYIERHRHPSVRRARWSTRLSAATFAPSAVLGRQAVCAVKQLGIEYQEQMGIADGAEWIKTETHKPFSGATWILDWPHLWRTIAKAVRAVALPRQADQKWVRQQFKQLGDWLWKGQVEPARALLQQWQEEQKGHPPIKALTAAIRYLQTQRGWIGNYEQWKQQGYPVGSGIIERAVSVVINRRMKRRGMSWLRKNATSVVALRVAWLNDDWLLPAPARQFP